MHVGRLNFPSLEDKTKGATPRLNPESNMAVRVLYIYPWTSIGSRPRCLDDVYLLNFPAVAQNL